MKLHITKPVDTQCLPSNTYELVLTFSFRSSIDEQRFLFPNDEEEDLIRAIKLIQSYFDLNWKDRCGRTLDSVIDTEDLKHELKVQGPININKGPSFYVFLNDIFHSWPHSSNKPYTLTGWNLVFYSEHSHLLHVEVED